MKFLILIVTTLMSFSIYAQKGTTNQSQVAADDFTCAKHTGITLAEFKMKLIESCDLNKPFSASLSTVINDANYFFCCQKKK